MHPSENQAPSAFGNPACDWYAVYTRHQHEKSVAQQLTQKGFAVLLPLYRSTSRWSDRAQIVNLPLFPNYLFVESDVDGRGRVLRTPGVCSFVGSQNGPSPILPDEIRILRKLVESPAQVEPHEVVECGDQVRVLRGPFTGLQGILLYKKNRHRVVISLELLRKAAAVEVDQSDIERAEFARGIS